MRVDEIFSGLKKMAKDAIKSMNTVTGETGEIETIKKDGKVVPRSRMMAALADASAGAKKTTKAPVMPTGKVPVRK